MTNTFQIKTEANLSLQSVEVRVVGKDSFTLKCKGVGTFSQQSKAFSEVEVIIPASSEVNGDLALHVDMFIKAITKTLEKKE